MSTSKIVATITAGCGCLAVVMAAACGGLLYFGYKTANDSVGPKIDHLLAAIENDTFGDTYETDTTPEFQAATSKEQYADLGNAIATGLGSLKSKSLKSFKFNMQQHNADSSVDVSYNARFEKGNGEIVAKLKKQDGEWKLVTFRVNSPLFQQDIATAKCPKCGAPHAASARFCPSCGAPLAQPDDKSVQNAEVPPADK
jgi:rubrerythrin